MTDVVKEPSLTEYLKKPYFDPLVAQLADTAAARYQQEPLKSQHMKAKATDAPGGGRQEGWITATFGRGESESAKVSSLLTVRSLGTSRALTRRSTRRLSARLQLQKCKYPLSRW
jgi:hypothetical protein